MKAETAGIHHVTAIGRDPQINVDFYTRVLGLRLVKRTVNFDDPGTYHFYYGDESGQPGTIMTFFPWPGSRLGRQGSSQVGITSFSVPEDALGFWSDRLSSAGVAIEGSESRFEEEALTFRDPDGLRLEIVSEAQEEGHDAGSAIRGFHSVTLIERRPEKTVKLLTELMGFKDIAEAGDRTRLAAGGTETAGQTGRRVDLLYAPDESAGDVAAGTVHHVAWRSPDHESQAVARESLLMRGLNVTDILDRTYFQSIYFREPGGVLFEIATDTPGFTVDETIEALGSELKLPDWLEDRRGTIEAALPAISTPDDS